MITIELVLWSDLVPVGRFFGLYAVYSSGFGLSLISPTFPAIVDNISGQPSKK